MNEIEILKAEIEGLKKQLAEAKARTWTVWVGKPSDQQSKNVKANVCFTLMNNGKPVFQVRGFPVGGQEVVGGIRPWFFVPETEGGFQPFTFNQEKERDEKIAKFPINPMEKVALWALKKAEKGEALKKYPVRFGPIVQHKKATCDCKGLSREEVQLRTVERGPDGQPHCLKCGEVIEAKGGGTDDLPF